MTREPTQRATTPRHRPPNPDDLEGGGPIRLATTATHEHQTEAELCFAAI